MNELIRFPVAVATVEDIACTFISHKMPNQMCSDTTHPKLFIIT